MKDRIFYLGFYNNDAIKDENRVSFPAADTKMDYVRTVLAKLAKHVHIISASGTQNSKCVFGRTTVLDEQTDLKTFTSLGSGWSVKRFVGRCYLKLQLLWHMISNIKSTDIIVVYHSLSYMNLVRFAKKVKHFQLIEEVEEIYSDVTGNTKTLSSENNYFKIADAYIFSTQLLNEKINLFNKPYVVANGSYSSESVIADRFNDSRIHVVYAGTLDPRKGGAVATIEATEYLNENFHVHILGFGSEKEISAICSEIKRISEQTQCKITYEGLKRGDEYIKFLQSCHIGMSTQNPDAAFNSTSFPSKILVYLANGLRVVSVRIPAIETSSVGNHLYFYDEQSPLKIAEAILNIDFNDEYDSRSVISELDREFEKGLGNMVKLLD